MLLIARTAFLTMLAHCQACYPQEACGLLAGSGGRFMAVYLIANTLASPVNFQMAPEQQLQAMLHSEAAGLAEMAIFHSHPHGPAQPSATDQRLAYYPDWPQFIISLARREAPAAGAFAVSQTAVTPLAWGLE